MTTHGRVMASNYSRMGAMVALQTFIRLKELQDGDVHLKSVILTFASLAFNTHYTKNPSTKIRFERYHCVKIHFFHSLTEKSKYLILISNQFIFNFNHNAVNWRLRA